MDEVDQLINKLIAEGASDEDITAIVSEWKASRQNKPAGVETQPNIFTGSATQNITQGARGVGDAIYDTVTGLPKLAWNAVTNPVDTGSKLAQAQLDTLKRGQTAPTLSERIGYTAAGVIPVLGPALASMGEDIGSGDPRRMGRGGTNALLTIEGVSPTARQATMVVAKPAARGVAALGRGAAEISPRVIDTAVGGLTGGWKGAVRGAYGSGPIATIRKALDRLAGTVDDAPKGTLRPPPGFEDTLRTELARRLDDLPERGVPGDLPDTPFSRRLGDAPAWADAVAAKRVPIEPSPNTGGRLVPGSGARDPIQAVLEEARAMPSYDPPTSSYLPPQAQGLPPTASSVESIARQLAQGTRSADDVRFDAKVFESEFPKPQPKPKPVSSIVQGMTEAGRQPRQPVPEIMPVASHTQVAPAASAQQSVIQRLAQSIAPRSSKSKGVKLSPNDVRFLQERGLSIDDYEAGVPEVIAAVEEARAARHATKYSNAQADAAYRRRTE